MTVNMITKSKITINNIIEFIHTAMNKNLDITEEFTPYKYGFTIINDDTKIHFFIDDDSIAISTSDHGYVNIEYQLTERDKLDLEALKLDVKEYNEEKALNLFADFFNYIPQTPASIDNLDDDD